LRRVQRPCLRSFGRLRQDRWTAARRGFV